MGIDNRVEATAKNLEGKAQEAYGEMTGSKTDEMAGQAKQAQASAEHATEDVKDEVKKTID